MEFVMGLCDQVLVMHQGCALTGGLARAGPRQPGRARGLPRHRRPKGEAADMLTISGLFAGYGGGDVLRGVDLTVAEGSITCVVGPNGAGKSTLLKVVSGLLRPRVGSLTFRGTEIGGATPRKILEAGIVQVMQSRNLFPELTVRQNVEIGGYLLRDRPGAQPPGRGERPVPDRGRAGQRAGRPALRRPAADGGAGPGADARSRPGGAGRAVDGTRAARGRRCTTASSDMAQTGRTILLVEQNVRAGRARHARRGDGGGPGQAGGHRRRDPRQPADARALPRRHDRGRGHGEVPAGDRRV